MPLTFFKEKVDRKCAPFWGFFVPLQAISVFQNGKLFGKRKMKSCPKRKILGRCRET
jgi:hypothetical protein